MIVDLSGLDVSIDLSVAAGGTQLDTDTNLLTLVDAAGNVSKVKISEAWQTPDNVWHICIGPLCGAEVKKS